MSLTPSPNFGQLQQTAKSFWDRKEGQFSKKVLIGAGVGIAAVAFLFREVINSFIDFVIGLATDGVHLALLLGALAVITSPIWNSSVRLFCTNAFQLSMRWAYQSLIAKDPIGMLRNNVLNLQKQGEEFGKAVTDLAGSKQRLEADLLTQTNEISKDKNLAIAAQKQIDKINQRLPSLTGNDRQEALLAIQREQLAIQGYKQAAGISLQTIRAEQPILNQTNKMYDQLCRLRDLASFKVASLTQQADMYSKQRATILASQRALGAAGRILKGDPQQLAIVDQTIEYLNNEAADTIGAMNDFNRWSERYLTDMDVQNDAMAEEATKMFAQMETKLALPGSVTPTITEASPVVDTSSLMDDFPDPNAPIPVPIPVDVKKK